METYDAQPWDCASYNHAMIDRATPCPWLAKVDGKMLGYLFTKIMQRAR